MPTKKAAAPAAKKAAKTKATKATASENPTKVTENITEAESVAESSTSIETPIEATPPANVIWSSEKNEDGALKHGEPPSFVRIGMLKIEVPETAVQLKGFYSEHARLLIRSIGGYKALVPKG
jgi:hypothetical protein